jgi:hypothetical protein
LFVSTGVDHLMARTLENHPHERTRLGIPNDR